MRIDTRDIVSRHINIQPRVPRAWLTLAQCRSVSTRGIPSATKILGCSVNQPICMNSLSGGPFVGRFKTSLVPLLQHLSTPRQSVLQTVSDRFPAVSAIVKNGEFSLPFFVCNGMEESGDKLAVTARET